MTDLPQPLEGDPPVHHGAGGGAVHGDVNLGIKSVFFCAKSPARYLKALVKEVKGGVVDAGLRLDSTQDHRPEKT